MHVFNPVIRIVCGAALLLGVSSAQAQRVQKDVPYVPTPEQVVAEMLKQAQVKKGDLVYDLGCGDGRIVITAAKEHGARGIGVDIDPERIEDSNRNAQQANVTDRVKFIQKNLFEMDFKDADVVTLYLLTSVNAKLRPKLLAELRPGVRVVSHAFDMGDWKPENHVHVEPEGQSVYLWIIPAKVEGNWTGKVGDKAAELQLSQKYQEVTGSVSVDGKKQTIKEGKLKGKELTLSLEDGKKYTATVEGDQITGEINAKKQG